MTAVALRLPEPRRAVVAAARIHSELTRRGYAPDTTVNITALRGTDAKAWKRGHVRVIVDPDGTVVTLAGPCPGVRVYLVGVPRAADWCADLRNPPLALLRAVLFHAETTTGGAP